MYRYLIPAALLLCAAGPTAPIFDGISLGYSARTVDITALTAAGKAIGDGSTDASPAFTAAFAKTAATTIRIPCGTYKLTATKAFSNSVANLNLIGEGRDCVTITFPAASTLSSAVFFFFGTTSVVSGITIDLTNATLSGTTPTGIIRSNLGNLTVVDSAIIAGTQYMNLVLVQNAQTGFRVDRNILSFTAPVATSGNAAMLVTSADVAPSKRGFFQGNTVTNADISVDASDTIIAGNTFNNWGLQGAAIFSSASINSFKLTIANNEFIGGNGGGILGCLEIWSRDSIVTGNRAYSCPGNGYDIGGKNTLVAGNIAVDVGSATGSSVGFGIRYLSSTYNGNGSHFAGNATYQTNTDMDYGFADQQFAAGVGCDPTQVCSATLGVNQFTGTLGPAQVRSTGVTYADGVSGLTVNGGTTGGSANAQTITAVTSPPILISTLSPGLTVNFVPGATNTGAATLNVKTGIATLTSDNFGQATKSTGALAIKKKSGASLVDVAANDIVTAIPATVVYDGTVWVLR